jgi:hypothetical protein
MEYWKQILGTVLLSLVGLVVYQALAFTERRSVKKILDGCRLLFDKAMEQYHTGPKGGILNSFLQQSSYRTSSTFDHFFAQIRVYQVLTQDPNGHQHLMNAYGPIIEKLLESFDRRSEANPSISIQKGQIPQDIDFTINYLTEKVQTELVYTQQYDAKNPTRFAYEDDEDMSMYFSIDLEQFTMALFTYKLVSEPVVGRFSYGYTQELTILATYAIDDFWSPKLITSLNEIGFTFDQDHLWDLTEQRFVTRLQNMHNWDFFPLCCTLVNTLASLVDDNQLAKSGSLINKVEPILRGHINGGIDFYLSGLLPLLWKKLDHYYALQDPKMILEVAEEILSYPNPDETSDSHDLYLYVEFQYDWVARFDVMIKKTEALMQLKRPKQALLALNEAMLVLHNDYYLTSYAGFKSLRIQHLAIDILKANHYYIATRELKAYRETIYSVMT